MTHLMGGDHLRAWTRTDAADFYRSRDWLNVSLRDVELEVNLLAARIAAAYLLGATHALTDETERILKIGPRPAQPPVAAHGVSEEGAQSEPDATGFSGAPEPQRERLA